MPEYSDTASAVGFNEGMRMMNRAGALAVFVLLAGLVGLAAQAQDVRNGQRPGRVRPDDAEQLFALANLARMHAGAGRLKWDPALAEAARQHCVRMAQEGPIEHRYGGEPSLTERAAAAGAHFSLVEENVAVGPSADAIHEEWMHSPPHRTNMLNPKVDRIGTAIVAARGTLYAVADFSAAVQQLSPAQVEARVGNLIRVSGVSILPSPEQARQACATDEGMPPSKPGMQPLFLMRWQSSTLDALPKVLTETLASGRYRGASVGSCKPEGTQDSFSAYRVAVLLY
ncbi:MAG: CAP domain-containing protein [Terracidiphilus sp.]